MSTLNPGMDAETFDQFIDQLRRYVRDRLIPAEAAVEELGRVPDDILGEMRDMGLFGVTSENGLAVRVPGGAWSNSAS